MALKLIITVFWSMAVVILLNACTDKASFSAATVDEKTGRWYSEQLLEKGQDVFESNCIDCHKAKARGILNWKKSLEDGSYPPPPLNGSAHAWHHSMPVLLRMISEGGVPMGGKMPAFKGILDEEEKLAVVAYFQQFWADEIYSRWLRLNE